MARNSHWLLVLALALAHHAAATVLRYLVRRVSLHRSQRPPARCPRRWQGDVVVAGRFAAIGRVATPSHVARMRDGVWEP